MRINMIMPDDLVQQIDDLSSKLGITRTAYVVMAMNQKVQSEVMLQSMPDMQKLMNDVQIKLASMGDVPIYDGTQEHQG